MDRAPESFPAAAHLAALVESSEDAILSKALDGTIRTWNAGAQRLYGYRAEEVVGQPFAVLLPPERAAEADAIMARLRRGEPVAHFETVRVRKDGTRVDVSVSYSPIRDEAGRLVGAAVIGRDVTERKRAERALREAEARFAAIIDHSPSCIFAKDAQGRYLLANQALARFAGRDVSEFPGRTDADFFPPEVAAQFAQDDAAVLAGGQARTYEETFPHGGGAVTALTVKFPLLDADGRPYAVCGIATDVTGQRQAQEELSKFALLVENSHDFIGIWGPQYDPVYVNRAGLALVGLGGPGPMRATPLREYFFPEDRPFLFEQFFPRVLREGHGEVEVRFRHFQTGEALWMVYSVLALKDAAGRPAGLATVSRNVSERKRAEHALRFLADASATLATLVDYESTLQKVASLAVPDFADFCAVDLAEPDGTLRRVAVAHVDPAKLRLAYELHRLYPPDPSEEHGSYGALHGGETDMMEEIPPGLLEQSARDEGHRRLFRELGLRSYMCVPLKARSRALGVISFVTAESGRRYTQEDRAFAEELARRAAIAIENAQLYHELREADRLKDEFLAMLAHELRNPLAPIRNSLYVMKQPAANGAMLDQAREMAERQVGHMARLLEDLLDVSRISRGKIELRKEVVEVAPLLGRTAEALRPQVEERCHELTIALPAGALRVEADPARLEQVVTNLLTNAVKYTDPGGHIWLSAERDGGEAVIRVRDTGIGITGEMLTRVFDLFVQAERRLDRSQGGVGIGLTLVKRLVEMHGGTVRATSAGPGQGSEFVVRLPAVAEQAAGKPAGRAEEGAAAALPRRRALVVDDNVDSADSLGLLLTLSGQEVRVAYDGPTALLMAEAFRPELVLLDIGMPGMDGYEVARRLRRLPGLERVVVVAVTGWGQEEDRLRSREAGFDYHLTKPADPGALHRLLAGDAAAAHDKVTG
jgi:PAS domain S-box-containing protein